MKTVYIYLAFFYFAITVACFDVAALMIICVQALTYMLGCGTVGTEQTTEFFTCSVQFLSLFFQLKKVTSCPQ